jgi:hypothetical protein
MGINISKKQKTIKLFKNLYFKPNILMKNILAIIPAAGKPNNTIFPSYNNLPDCMIPINSKPIIGHILDNLLER